ncbi:hypothetical protein [Nannocystis sp.]
MVDNDSCNNMCKSTLKKSFGPAQCTLNQDCASQCTPWNNFRASLGAGPYTKITLRGSNDMVGRVCNGATAQTLCQALKNGTAVGPLACDGNNWRTGNCGGGLEINADGTLCSCDNPGWIVRPCIGGGNPNWGGMNSATCNGPSQTLEVICE